MTLVPLAQSEALTEFQRALRDHFREGGSISAFLLTALGLLGFVMMVYALVRWQQRAAAPAVVRNDPQKLYIGLLKKLNLGREQTDWLIAASRRAHLPHPTLMLLCEKTFDECAGGGTTASTTSLPPAESPARPTFDLVALRRKLFGGASPFVISSIPPGASAISAHGARKIR